MTMTVMVRRGRGVVGSAVVVAAVVSLVAASGAGADDSQKVQLTATGQAIARAAVIHKSDLGSLWTGKVTNGDSGGVEDTTCPGFQPKRSDLVLIGSATSGWHASSGLLQIASSSEVLKTPTMARLYWKRTFGPEVKFLTCLRSEAAKTFGVKPQQMSVGELGNLGFPKSAATVLGYGLHFDAVRNKLKVPYFVSFVWIGRGRTMTSVLFVAPQAFNQMVLERQRAFMKIIVARLKAAGS